MGKLSDWFAFYYDEPGNKIGEEKFINGEPGFKFDYDNKNQMKAKNDRQDVFTTRITAHIIDVNLAGAGHIKDVGLLREVATGPVPSIGP